MNEEIERRLPAYRVEAELGRGSMGVVYLAEERTLGRKVALKVLAPEHSEDEEFRQRFIRESRMAAALDHANVIPIYTAGESDGLLYLAMRYVDGTDLRELLKTAGPLPLARAQGLVRQIAAALDAAHERRLVHRDVKPANILIRGEGGGREHVYLCDFGITKHQEGDDLTSIGQFVGTLDYVSPEQIQGRPIDGRADVYSLGVVLFQCLTGRVPFPQREVTAKLIAHLTEEVPAVTVLRPDLPPGADRVVARAMAKLPEDRYATCGELVAELLAVRAAVRQTPSQAAAAVRAEPDEDPSTNALAAPVPRPPSAPPEPARRASAPAGFAEGMAAAAPRSDSAEPAPTIPDSAPPSLWAGPRWPAWLGGGLAALLVVATVGLAATPTPSTPGAALSPAESALYQRIPETDCAPASDLTDFPGATAGVRCTPIDTGASAVSYYQFADLTTMRDVHKQGTQATAARSPGDCVDRDPSDPTPGEESYYYVHEGAHYVGRSLCYPGADGAPVIQWISDPALILASATGPDQAALMSWWGDHGGPDAGTVAAGLPTPEPFPNDEEQRLLGRIPLPSRINCFRAEDLADHLQALAGVQCGPTSGAGWVFYYQFPDSPSLEAVYAQDVAQVAPPAAGPSCDQLPPGFTAEHEYDQGRLLCSTQPSGRSVVEYTDAALNILVKAYSSSANDLMAWWASEAGPL